MDTIKINYSRFSPVSLLDELYRHYDLPSDSSCIFFESGLNDIYKITAVNDTYYLRVSLCGVYSTKQINEEIEYRCTACKSVVCGQQYPSDGDLDLHAGWVSECSSPA